MTANSINALQAAVISDFATRFEVHCDAYAGQFGELAVRKALVKTPSILVDFESGEESSDPGTEQVDLKCRLTAYAITRLANGPNARNQSAQDLAQSILVKLKYNRFGLTGIQVPAEIKIKPVNHPVFVNNALGVCAVSWSQILRLGDSIWTGGAIPEEVWLGLSPEIGVPFVDRYVQVAP